MYPTHNSRSTYAWIEKEEEFPQPIVSGRDRVNINGLLNAYDVTDVIAHDCDSVNALSTKALYEKALIKHPEVSIIYIISDNANIIGTKICRNGSRHKNRSVVLTRVFSKFKPYRAFMEILKKVINTGFYRSKEMFRKAAMNFFARIDEYEEE